MAYDPSEVTHYVIKKEVWEKSSAWPSPPIIENSLDGLKVFIVALNRICSKVHKDHIKEYFEAFKASHQGQLPPLLKFLEVEHFIPDTFNFKGKSYEIASIIRSCAGHHENFLIPVVKGFYAREAISSSNITQRSYITDYLKIKSLFKQPDLPKIGLCRTRPDGSLSYEVVDIKGFGDYLLEVIKTKDFEFGLDTSSDYFLNPFRATKSRDYLNSLKGRKVKVNLKKHEPANSSFSYKHYLPTDSVGNVVKGKVTGVISNTLGDYVAEVELLESPFGIQIVYPYALEVIEEVFNFGAKDKEFLDKYVLSDLTKKLNGNLSKYFLDPKVVDFLLSNKPEVLELPEATQNFGGLKALGKDLLSGNLSDELEKLFSSGAETEYQVFVSVLEPDAFTKIVSLPLVAFANEEILLHVGDKKLLYQHFDLSDKDPLPLPLVSYLKELGSKHGLTPDIFDELYLKRFAFRLYVVKDTRLLDKKIKALWTKIQESQPVSIKTIHSYNKLNIKKWLEQ